LGNEAYFTNVVVEVVVQDGARLEHTRLQQENSQSFQVAAISVELDVAVVTTRPRSTWVLLARHDISVVMNHEGAECWVRWFVWSVRTNTPIPTR
jgi:hypothetical protein